MVQVQNASDIILLNIRALPEAVILTVHFEELSEKKDKVVKYDTYL